MGALSSSSPLILRCIFRRPPPSTTTSVTTHLSSITPSFLKPTPSIIISLASPIFPLPLRSLSTTSSSHPTISPVDPTPPQIIPTGDDHPVETEPEKPVDPRIASAHQELMSKLKSMSVKEKKELGSYANSLGKKLKSQQVGKSGVTDAVGVALVETLEANELLKLKIHNNCPGELDEVVSRLEEATGSVVVGRIGRTVIIYRPSLTKLIAEEKKKQNMKLMLKRRAAYKASYQGRMQSRGQSTTSSSRSREYRS